MTGGRKSHPTPLASLWPCVFPHPATELVDAEVDKVWKAAIGPRTPFGDLRNMWRRHHCRTLNPYGSETCPYLNSDCAGAFLDAVRLTAQVRPKVPVGYFLAVSKTMGAVRADNKPLNRGRMDVLDAQGPRHAGDVPAGDGPRREEVRRAATGPISLGDVLRALRVEPHQGPAGHEPESPER